MMRRFETDRIRARPLEAADAALFCQLYGNEQTMRYIGRPLPAAKAASRFAESLRSAAARRPPFLFAIEPMERRPIGLCGVVQIDAACSRAEIGMMLLPDACASGYASEVLPALTTAAFLAFPIDRVWVQYAPAHVAAERLVVRTGFVPSGEAEIAERRPENRVWAVDRPFWMTSKQRKQGEHHQCRA